MTIKTPDTEEKTPAPSADPPKTPPADPPKTPAPSTKTPPADPPKTPPAAAEGSKRVVLKDADDELPEDAEMVEMSTAALRRRIQRATTKERRELLERFGTSDPDKIQQDLNELKSLREEKEKARQAQLSNEEKLKEQLRLERQKRQDAERRSRQAVEERVVEREETRITRLAEKAGVDPDYIEENLTKFAAHLKAEYTDEQLAKLADKDIEGWWKDLLKKKPKLAKDYQAESPKVPLTNGSRSNGSAPSSSGTGGPRTYSPSGPNAMTSAEARAAAAREGYKW